MIAHWICSVSPSRGMDSNSRADSDWHRDRLLLHHGPAAPGVAGLLHQGLALADLGCVLAVLRGLPVLLVRALAAQINNTNTN